MSAYLRDPYTGLRSTELLPASSAFTHLARVVLPTGSVVGTYATLLYRGDDPETLYAEYVWFGVNVATRRLELFVGNSDSDVGEVVPYGARIAYTYNPSTHVHTVTANDVVVATVTKNITAWTFTHEYIGKDFFAPDWSPFSVRQVRQWAAVLTGDEQGDEWASPVAVRTANLWRDTPLETDLLDDAGADHEWAQDGGTVIFGGSVAGRFYIQPNTVDWLPFATYRGGWDGVDFVRRRLSPTKDSNSITTVNATETNAGAGTAHGVLQLILGPLAAQTLGGTLDVVLGVREGLVDNDNFYRLHAWASVGATDVLRGTALNEFEDSVEFPTTAMGKALGSGPQSIAGVALSDGDFLVVELGYRADNADATSRFASFNIGTRQANGDLSDGATPTSGATGLNGFLEFSQPLLFPAAPPNDRVADAEIIASLPFEDTLDTRWATGVSGDGEDPYHGDSYNETHSVHYLFTATANGIVPIHTEGSDYPTIVSVWNDGDLTEGNDLASGVDPTLAAPLEVAVAAGSTYHVMVQRHNADGGGPAGTLVLAIGAGSDAGDAPDHDECSTPRVIGAVPYVDAGVDVTGATVGLDDPPSSLFNGHPPYHSVWYEFATPGATKHYLIDTSDSDYDARWVVLKGSCGSFVASTDGSTFLAFRAVAGETYRIIVYADTPGGGALTFRLTEANQAVDTLLGGSIGLATDHSRQPQQFPSGAHPLLSIFTAENIGTVGPAWFELWPVSTNFGEPYPAEVLDMALMLRYRDGGTMVRYPVADYVGGPPDGMPVVLQTDSFHNNLDGTHTIYASPTQTVEARWQFASRNTETGIYNRDGILEIRVGGELVPELCLYDLPWNTQIEPYGSNSPLFGQDEWGVYIRPSGHLSAYYLMGEPRFATGFGQVYADGSVSTYPSDIALGVDIHRHQDTIADADADLILNRNLTASPVGTIENVFLPTGIWSARQFYGADPYPQDITGNWDNDPQEPDLEPGPIIDAGSPYTGGWGVVELNGVVWSQFGGMLLSSIEPPPPPPPDDVCVMAVLSINSVEAIPSTECVGDHVGNLDAIDPTFNTARLRMGSVEGLTEGDDDEEPEEPTRLVTTTVVTVAGGPSFEFTGANITPASVAVTGLGLSLTPAPVYANNVNAGTATASYSYPGDDDFLPSSDSEEFFITRAATVVTITLAAGPYTYTGAPLTPATARVTGPGGLDEAVAVTYSANTNAGTATATAVYAGTANYLGSSDSEDFTIDKAPTVTTVTIPAGPYVETGAAIEPATVTVIGAALSLTPAATYVNNVIPGTATASYSFVATANHLASSDSEDFLIIVADEDEQEPTVTEVTIGSGGGPFEYTGAAITPATVTVTGPGLSLTPPANYLDNVEPGEATAFYNYPGSIDYLPSSNSKHFTIGKAPTVTTVTVPGAPFVETGSPLTPALVTVTGPGLSLTPPATYVNNVAPGTATASYSYPGSSRYLPSSDSQDFEILEDVVSELGLLGPADASYLGVIKMPVQSTDKFPFAVRRNAGVTTLVAFVNLPYTAGLYEVSCPTPNLVLGSASTATIIKSFGDVCEDILSTTRGTADPANAATLNGIVIDPDNPNRLWLSYRNSYPSYGYDDPVIFEVTVDWSAGTFVTRGPWRTKETSNRTHGYFVTLSPDYAAAHTGGRRLCVGGPQGSVNANGPVGPVLYNLHLINPATRPPDTTGNQPGVFSMDTDRMIHHDATTPAARATDYKGCGWNATDGTPTGTPPDYTGAHGSWGPIAGDPTWNEFGYRTSSCNGFQHVYTETKHALVAVATMVGAVAGYTYPTDGVPHLWYGLAGALCPHGHNPGGFAGTGQKATTAVGRFLFFDPAHVAEVLAGTRLPSACTPVVKNIAEYPTLVKPDGVACTSNWEWQSMAFEPETKRLYVPQTERLYDGAYRALIHVFQF